MTLALCAARAQRTLGSGRTTDAELSPTALEKRLQESHPERMLQRNIAPFSYK
jgi:hypothetical protein